MMKRRRSKATKARPRKEDGTLTSVPTDSGGTFRDRKADREKGTATAKTRASMTGKLSRINDSIGELWTLFQSVGVLFGECRFNMEEAKP